MGMFTKIRGMFTRRHDDASSQNPRPEVRRQATWASICPENPIGLDLSASDSTPDMPAQTPASAEPELAYIAEVSAVTTEAPPPVEPAPPARPERRARLISPRNRSELMTELRGNYAEVIELVRKVNDHLDVQETRSSRMMEIAERIPSALEYLPEIQRQNTQVVESLDRCARNSTASADRIGGAVDRLVESTEQQGTSVTALNDRLESARQTDLELVQRMAEFRTTMSGIADTNSGVSDSIAQMHSSALRRDEEIVRLIEQSRKWMVVALASIGGAVGLAIMLAVFALVF